MTAAHSKWVEWVRTQSQEIGSRYPIFRRRKYLLYRFQSKYAMVMVALAGLITVMIATLLYRYLAPALSDYSLDGGEGGVEQHLGSLVMLVGILIVLELVVFFAIIIVMSHRVAGPMFVMTRYMSALAEGKYPVMRDLRESDELKDFFAHFKATVERLRSRDKDEGKRIQDALEVLSPMVSGKKAQEALGDLQMVLERKQEAMGIEPKRQEESSMQESVDAA